MEPVRITLHQNVTACWECHSTEDFIESTLQRLGFQTRKARNDCLGSHLSDLPGRHGTGSGFDRGTGPLLRISEYSGRRCLRAKLSERILPFMFWRIPSGTFSSARGIRKPLNLSFASEADHGEFPPLEGGRVASKKSAHRGHPIYAHDAGAGSGAIGKDGTSILTSDWSGFLKSGRCMAPGRMECPGSETMLGILGTGGFAGQNWTNPARRLSICST